MPQNQLKPAIQRKHCGLLSCGMSAAWQHPASYSPSYREKIRNLKLKVLLHPPYSPYLAPSDLHFFWPLKDATHGHNFRSNVIGWHNNQKIPYPDNLGLSGMLEKVCRTWWGWHWKLMSLSVSIFALYQLYNFSSFHLNDPCRGQWPVNIRWVRMMYVWASNQAALLVWVYSINGRCIQGCCIGGVTGMSRKPECTISWFNKHLHNQRVAGCHSFVDIRTLCWLCILVYVATSWTDLII